MTAPRTDQLITFLFFQCDSRSQFLYARDFHRGVSIKQACWQRLCLLELKIATLRTCASPRCVYRRQSVALIPLCA